MGDRRERADDAQSGAGETEVVPGFRPEQPPMDDAAGGPQADDDDGDGSGGDGAEE